MQALATETTQFVIMRAVLLCVFSLIYIYEAPPLPMVFICDNKRFPPAREVVLA